MSRQPIATAAVDWEPLLGLLVRPRSGALAFNQYRDTHPELDRLGGAGIRLRNLRCYLDVFAQARFLLIGEAAGYAGCRFSGIPFTCEAQIVGRTQLGWTQGLPLARSSRGESPRAERSATVVWQVLGPRRDCLLWNAFPWHPMGSAGPLSNRRPGCELHSGLEALQVLLACLPSAQPVAIGRVAQRALALIGVDAPHIRHPSHGGSSLFRAGIAALGGTAAPPAGHPPA